jgi:hypothetical protein
VLIGGVYTVTGTEAEIRAAVDEFCITPPSNADGNRDPDVADAGITVRVTTQDSHDGIFSNGDRATTTAQHEFTVQADADTPLAAAADVDGVEDTTFKMWPGGTGVSVGLTIRTARRRFRRRSPACPSSWTITADTSGGGTFTRNGDGSLSLTGTEAQINAILAGIELRAPLNWSGVIPGVQLLVTATEAATGHRGCRQDGAGRHHLRHHRWRPSPTRRRSTSWRPTAGNAGYEDTPIKIGFTTQLVDGDGSEALLHEVRGLPAGALFCNASGVAIGTAVDTDGNGTLDAWRFTASEIAQLHVLPELHSNLDFTLEVRRGVDREQRGAHPAGLRRRRLFELGAAAGRGDRRRRQGDTDHHPDRRGRGCALPARPGHLRIAGRHRHPAGAANSESLYFVIVGLPSASCRRTPPTSASAGRWRPPTWRSSLCRCRPTFRATTCRSRRA